MRIKIVRHIKSEFSISKSMAVHTDLYNVYHGFTGLPYTFPFFTKWMLEKENLNYNEMSEYLTNCAMISPVTLIECK